MTKITLEQIKEIGESEITTYAGEKALEAVRQDGCALRYVHEQTPEICLEAVRQNGLALQHVHKQTPEICLEAVRQNGDALRYVDESIFKMTREEEIIK
jgi:hypothetical protein